MAVPSLQCPQRTRRPSATCTPSYNLLKMCHSPGAHRRHHPAMLNLASCALSLILLWIGQIAGVPTADYPPCLQRGLMWQVQDRAVT